MEDVISEGAIFHESIGDAWKALNLRTRYYTTRLHVGAFYLPAFLEEMLREVEEPK